MGSHRSWTGRPRTWNISFEESCPSTRPKLGDWLGAPGRSFCWVMKRSSITAVPRASSSDASPSPKDKSCYKKYIRGLVTTMQHLEPSWEMTSNKASTGQPWWPTPLGLYAPAGVSVLCKADTPVRSGPTDDTHHLAVCCVGSGTRRPLAEGTQRLHAPAGRHRQVLQVDRGPTLNQYQV
jgi:hypothetical protein